MLGYQHQWRKFPDLDDRCIICSRKRTPDNEALECLKPETFDLQLYLDTHKEN